MTDRLSAKNRSDDQRGILVAPAPPQAPIPDELSAKRWHLDPAAPCWTASGRRAELFAISNSAVEYVYTFLVADEQGRKRPVAYDRFGRCRRSPSLLDLTNRPPFSRNAGNGLDLNKPVRTRDGRRAAILIAPPHPASEEPFPITAACYGKAGVLSDVYGCDLSGKARHSRKADLLNTGPIDPAQPVATLEGRHAEIVDVDECSDFPIAAIVTKRGHSALLQYDRYGRSGARASLLDLTNIVPR